MKAIAALCSWFVMSLPTALAQPPDPPDPAIVTVCPKFYWGEWGGIHYYTASTCWTTEEQCVEGGETQAQSYRIHTTQPTCCPLCSDPIFSPSDKLPPPVGDCASALLQPGKKYNHRKLRSDKVKLMRVVKDNQGKDKDDYMKPKGAADPNHDYTFNPLNTIKVVLDAAVKVTNSNDGKEKYFRVLHLQCRFPGETVDRDLAVGQQLEKLPAGTVLSAEFVDDPNNEFFAEVKTELGAVVYQVEAHEKLKKKP
ncbi:MAG: hypothetical protein HYS13_04055 [Planctomycetia bacterium]|nr:hypothetical protein [Planctomycetia bacterium]